MCAHLNKHIHSNKGYEKIAKRLVDMQVKVDAVGHFDNTALLIASEKGNHRIVRMLTHAGTYICMCVNLIWCICIFLAH